MRDSALEKYSEMVHSNFRSKSQHTYTHTSTQNSFVHKFKYEHFIAIRIVLNFYLLFEQSGGKKVVSHPEGKPLKNTLMSCQPSHDTLNIKWKAKFPFDYIFKSIQSTLWFFINYKITQKMFYEEKISRICIPTSQLR